MITDEERREVAESLRNLDARKIRYAEQFCEELNDTVMNSWDFPSFQDLTYRLADLIEPEPERTCRYVWDERQEAWKCSECGGLEPACNGPSYCIDCGAKVVER